MKLLAMLQQQQRLILLLLLLLRVQYSHSLCEKIYSYYYERESVAQVSNQQLHVGQYTCNLTSFADYWDDGFFFSVKNINEVEQLSSSSGEQQQPYAAYVVQNSKSVIFIFDGRFAIFSTDYGCVLLEFRFTSCCNKMYANFEKMSRHIIAYNNYIFSTPTTSSSSSSSSSTTDMEYQSKDFTNNTDTTTTSTTTTILYDSDDDDDDVTSSNTSDLSTTSSSSSSYENITDDNDVNDTTIATTNFSSSTTLPLPNNFTSTEISSNSSTTPITNKLAYISIGVGCFAAAVIVAVVVVVVRLKRRKYTYHLVRPPGKTLACL